MSRAIHLERRLSGVLLATGLLALLSACAMNSTPHTSATATAGALTCTPSTPASAAPITTPGLQTTVSLPGNPFASVATHDGKWLFVSLNAISPGATHGIAVLHLDGQSATLAHIIPVTSPLGLTLTADDRTLIVAAYTGVAFVDVAKAEAGDADALQGTVQTATAATIEVMLSLDGRYAFATNEYQASMSVIDVRQAESDGYQSTALIGTVPLDDYPVGMALSPDGRYLYVTSEESQQSAAQQAQSGSRELNGLGTLSVVDVARAERDPAGAVISRVHVGCGDGRVVLSPDGSIAWVSARASNEVVALDTARLLSNPQHALLATIPVGSEPVGLLLVNGGTELLVANSNRFAQSPTPQTVYVVDTQAALTSRPALKGSIAVGIFPRELALAGQTIILTNYDSGTISLIDATRLP